MGVARSKKKDLTKYLMLITFVSCLGPFQSGFNFWLVHDPITLKQYLSNLSIQVVDKERQDEEIHPSLLIFTVAAFLLGCVFGSVLIGPLADKCGRKRALQVNDLINIVSGVTLTVSQTLRAHVVYALGRFMTGLGLGIFSSAVPLFLGEISPTNLRGGIATLPWLAISVGMVMSQLLGGPEVLGTKKGLPFLQSIPAIIAFFQFFLLLLFPESPRYLLIQRRDEEGARQALQKLRGQDDVEDEIEELRQEDLYEQEEKEMTILKLLCSPHLRWQLICVITLFMTQQFSGITAAYYYAEKVFRSMKVEKNNLRYSSALLTFCSLFGHGLSVYKMDSWGRRPLLLSGLGICTISCVLLTMTLELQVIMPWMAYVSSFLLFIFVIGIVLGPNCIPHLMLLELFLQSSRASAFLVVGFFQWFLIFAVGFAFVLTEKYIRTYSFLIFLPFCAAGFLYILKVVPETKRKTFLDIRKLLETLLPQKYLNEKPEAIKKKREKATRHSNFKFATT